MFFAGKLSNGGKRRILEVIRMSILRVISKFARHFDVVPS